MNRGLTVLGAVEKTLSVAILAGGMSRRMGRDKATIDIDGHLVIERTAMAVRDLTDDLFVVASHREDVQRLGFRVLPDLQDGAGSLGGIYSAVAGAQYDYCLVVACDMPLLNPRLLRFMSRIERDYDALVPVLPALRSSQGGGKTFETLHAIYGRSCMPVFERQIRAGRLKIADALHGLRVREIGEPELRRIDPDLHSFINVNRLEDIDLVRRLLAHQS